MELAKLKPTKEELPPRIVIYGTGKIGKSSFAADAPDTIFFDIENGLGGIESSKYPIKSWQDILQGITDLHEQDHSFRTLAVDSIDWMEKLIHEAVCQETGAKSIDDPNNSQTSYGKGYTYATNLWRQFLQGMTSLRDKKGMTIILIAHDQIVRYDDPSGEGYDRYDIKLDKRANGLVKEWADCILFAKQKVAVRKEDVGFNQKKAKGTDLGRFLYTTETPAYVAGHRVSLSLPDEVPLGWNNFISAIGQR